MRVLYAVTAPQTARAFLSGQLSYLARRGVEVAVTCDGDATMRQWSAAEGAAYVATPMRREIDLKADVASLARAVSVIRQVSPDVLVFGTPKATLIFSLAGVLARVPVRVAVVHGLRFPTLTGTKRRLVQVLELLPLRLATEVLVVSPLLRSQLSTGGLGLREEPILIAKGSANGISVPDPQPRTGQDEIRSRIAPDAPVVGFVGRLSRDKGVAELVAAFLEDVLPAQPTAQLVLVGALDDGDPLESSTWDMIQACDSVHYLGKVPNARSLMAQMDVVVLPSHRDGFGYTCLEAAVEGATVVCTRECGAAGSLIFDGESGLVIAAGDRAALGDALVRLLSDRTYALTLAAKAREIAVRDFASEGVWTFIGDFFEHAVADRRSGRSHAYTRLRKALRSGSSKVRTRMDWATPKA